jgi:hypothetical protein
VIYYDEFVARAKTLPTGDPLYSSTIVGRLVTQAPWISCTVAGDDVTRRGAMTFPQGYGATELDVPDSYHDLGRVRATAGNGFARIEPGTAPGRGRQIRLEALQAAQQLPPLGGVHVANRIGLELRPQFLDPTAQRDPGGGRLDQCGPAVVGIRPAAHKTCALHTLHSAGHRRRVGVELSCEIGWPLRTDVPQVHKQKLMPWMQTQTLQQLPGAHHMQASHPDEGIADRAIRRRRRRRRAGAGRGTGNHAAHNNPSW